MGLQISIVHHFYPLVYKYQRKIYGKNLFHQYKTTHKHLKKSKLCSYNVYKVFKCQLYAIFCLSIYVPSKNNNRSYLS